MNCKQGDLAVVIGYINHPENVGIICETSHIYRSGEVLRGQLLAYEHDAVGMWVVRSCGRPFITGSIDGMWHVVSDHLLRPIRDTDGQDETLTLVPHKETVKC